jgi:cytoskeletal protein RodZ
MEWIQWLLGVIVTGLTGVIMWIVGQVAQIRSDQAKLREQLPVTYVLREDYREDLREIKNVLVRIEEKLSDKVDK